MAAPLSVNKAKMMEGKSCVTEPEQLSLQAIVSEYYYNAYARKRCQHTLLHLQYPHRTTHKNKWR